MTKPSSFYKKIAARAEKVIAEKPMYKQGIELNLAILKAQLEAKEKIEISLPQMDAEKIAAGMKQGSPVFDIMDTDVDIEVGAGLFRVLLGVLKKHGEKLAEQMGKIEEALSSGDLVLDEFLYNASGEGASEYITDVAQRIGADAGLMKMLLVSSIKPYMEKFAETMAGKYDADSWMRPTCPVCGSGPYIAELRGKEGRRILHCPLCAAEWGYDRIKCTHCGNDDQETLSYFYAEEDGPGHRVDVCNKCKGSLKTVDSREFETDVIPMLEDWVTIHLDLRAVKEGYKRGN
jgi:FdhE protein